MKGLQDKVALVTGGSSGIGQAIAIRLGEEGANVAINYVGRPEGAISTREAIEHGVEICMKKMAEAGGRPILVAADVSDEQAVDQMFDRVLSEYGRLDVLVNNAGIQVAEDSTNCPPRTSTRSLRSTSAARSCAHATRCELPGRAAAWRDHQCVQRAPGDPEAAFPWLLGVEGRHAQSHLVAGAGVRRTGIRVNGIGPGATVTPINRSWIDNPVKRRMVESHIPMRRAGGAEEWPRWPRSSAPMKRRTSPAPLSSTAASPSTRPSRRLGRLSDGADRDSAVRAAPAPCNGGRGPHTPIPCRAVTHSWLLRLLSSGAMTNDAK